MHTTEDAFLLKKKPEPLVLCLYWSSRLPHATLICTFPPELLSSLIFLQLVEGSCKQISHSVLANGIWKTFLGSAEEGLAAGKLT